MTKKRDGSLRGSVISMWEKRMRPAWDLPKTLQATREADEVVERDGLNPATAYRAQREARNRAYEVRWVNGCHFPWLNPR